ncbi:MAG: LamG-like jellyroll fold domain-containing protein [archaeon]
MNESLPVKLLLISFVLIVVISIAVYFSFSGLSTPAGKAIYFDAPIAVYNFDNDTAQDSSGNGLHGVIEGNPVFVGTIHGKGLSFDGTGDDDYVGVPDNSLFDVQNFTIEAFIKPASDPNGWGGYHTIVSKQSQFIFRFGGSGLYGITNCGFASLLGNDFDWIAGRWYHLAFTYDGSFLRLYVDGTEKASTPCSTPPGHSDHTLLIGNHFGSLNNEFDGVIDEVVISNYAKTSFIIPNTPPEVNADGPYSGEVNSNIQLNGSATDDESIASIVWSTSASDCTINQNPIIIDYTATNNGTINCSTVGAKNLTLTATDNTGLTSTANSTVNVTEQQKTIALYHLNEGNGTIINDSSGNNLNGNIVGSPTFVGTPWVAGLNFNRSGGNYAEVPDDDLFDINSFTIEAWIKPATNTSSWSYYHTIVSKDAQYILGFRDNLIQGIVNPYAIEAPFNGTAGNWYHIAFTYDSITKRMKLYVGNTEVAASNPLSHGPIPSSGSLRIGNHSVADNHNEFDGVIDEVIISNYAKTSFDVSIPSDSIPPAKITDLGMNCSWAPVAMSCILNWTAPGDDGSSGLASSYDIRFSSSNFPPTTWDGALKVNHEPLPVPAGTPQSMTVDGLVPRDAYYFVMKTGDEVPNWSEMSNVAVWTRTSSDTIPPSAITNLSVPSCSNNSCSLSWTAPGDDGSSGTASQYDLRYSISNITESNWNSATQATGEPSPQIAGTTQSMSVTGLSPSTTYYFAIKTADEVPNWSAISNVPSRATGSTSDSTPPTVSITSPLNGATVSGVVSVSATASDNVGVTKVEFHVSNSLKSTDNSSPYSFDWNTLQYANGNYSLKAVAFDAADNNASSSINVDVNNSSSSVVFCGNGVLELGEACENDSHCSPETQCDSANKRYGERTASCSACECDYGSWSWSSTSYCSNCNSCGDDSCNCGETSTTCSGDCGGGDDTIPPSRPIGLTATSGEQKVDLDWNDNSEADLSHYIVFYGLSSGSYDWNVMVTSSSATILDLGEEVRYYFAVKAVDYTGNKSTFSDEVSAVTSAVSLKPPKNINISLTDEKIRVNWSFAVPEPDHYDVYKNGKFVTATTENYYLDSKYEKGETYSYYVKSIAIDGSESDKSKTVSISIPGEDPCRKNGECNEDCNRTEDPDCLCIENGICETEFENTENCPADCEEMPIDYYTNLSIGLGLVIVSAVIAVIFFKKA